MGFSARSRWASSRRRPACPREAVSPSPSPRSRASWRWVPSRPRRAPWSGTYSSSPSVSGFRRRRSARVSTRASMAWRPTQALRHARVSEVVTSSTNHRSEPIMTLNHGSDPTMTRRSHPLRRFGLVVFAWLTLGAAAVYAQDPASSPTPEAPKIDITGFVNVYYEYSFNKVDPTYRGFDVQHNAFSLSLAELPFAKGVTPESRGGFRVDLDFGKTADMVASFEPEGVEGKEIYKNITQAYGSLLTGKVQWDVGKFVTPHGAEGIESQDNWNYTRSMLF